MRMAYHVVCSFVLLICRYIRLTSLLHYIATREWHCTSTEAFSSESPQAVSVSRSLALLYPIRKYTSSATDRANLHHCYAAVLYASESYMPLNHTKPLNHFGTTPQTRRRKPWVAVQPQHIIARKLCLDIAKRLNGALGCLRRLPRKRGYSHIPVRCVK